MSHGEGAYAHPDTDYQSFRSLQWGLAEDARDMNRLYRQQKRLDATNPEENIDDMLNVPGNPDAFGPGPKLVIEKKRTPPSTFVPVKYSYGVNRQE
jgi:hypothetical protein